MKNLARSLSAAIVFCALALTVSPGARAEHPKDVTTILSAQADFTRNILTITGQDFGTGLPTVYLNATSLTIASNSDTQIVADLPATIGPGSYHLVVIEGGQGWDSSQQWNDQDQNSFRSAVLDVTLGVTGPQGPQGPQGIQAPPVRRAQQGQPEQRGRRERKGYKAPPVRRAQQGQPEQRGRRGRQETRHRPRPMAQPLPAAWTGAAVTRQPILPT